MLKILLDISEKMNETEDIRKLLADIIQIAKDYIHVKRISIMLVENGGLELRAYAGFEPKSTALPLNEGIAGTVAVTGEEYLVNGGSEADKRPEYDYAGSFLCLPMFLRGKIIGVMSLTNKEGDHFSENDVYLARYIAGQCALAVERHNLFREKRLDENLRIIGLLKSSVAHDMANLLGIVEVYLELLEGETASNPTLLGYVEAIHTEIKRASGLATDMLDFAKRSISLNRTVFSAGELVRDIEKHGKILVRDSGITLECRLAEDFIIKADKNRLFRVFFNLLKNAADALEGSKGKIVFKAGKAGDSVYFVIADNGCGINADSMEMLFNPFFTSGKINGTGLGLAVVKEIVDAHGGKVFVRSREGRYTCFLIRIPADGKA